MEIFVQVGGVKWDAVSLGELEAEGRDQGAF